MKKISLFLFCLIVLLFQSPVSAQDDSFQWAPGEELTYKVKWAFVRLGTLKLQLAGTVDYNGVMLYHVRLYLDSNPMLFFLNMHNVYDTYIDDQFRPYIHISNETIDGIRSRTEHHFNYLDSTMYIKITDVNDAGGIFELRKKFKSVMYDGVSMTYFARKNIHRHESVLLTSYFGKKQGDVLLNFRGVFNDGENDLAQQFDQSYMIDGDILLVGIAGINGPYKGWFGGRKERIPYRAEMEAFVGSVVVELENISKLSPADITKDIKLIIE